MSKDNLQLEVGSRAPDFTLKTNGNGELSLSQFKGNPVVLYFYPKDNTPGCTTEALDFSALSQDFAALGIKIIGVSPDSAQKHDNFVKKHNLSIDLAADTEKEVCEAYGVWVEKKMYGKTYMGVERSTFLIDAEGVLNEIWRKVKVKDHANQVLQAAKGLASSK